MLDRGVMPERSKRTRFGARSLNLVNGLRPIMSVMLGLVVNKTG